MKVLLLAGWLAAGALAAGYRIAGTVVNSATGQPVGGVRVTVAPVELPQERLPFVTGQDGRFVFAGMPQGKYELRAERRGFLTGSLSGAVAAGPDQRTDAIVLPIAPPAVIAGKVTDDIGEPVDQANVQLFSSAIVDGHRRVTLSATKQTADNGEYRFGGLPAGTYFLAVAGHPWYNKFNETQGDTGGRSMTHTGYAIQYYPAAGDPAAAEAIELKAGQELAADFSLTPLPAVAVRVHVGGSDDSRKQYLLTAAGPGGNPVVVRQGSEAGDLYNFWGVPPGHYVLEVRGELYAREPVDIGTVDMDVNVKPGEPPSLSGAVEIEGGGSLPAGASVVVSDIDSGSSESAPIGAGGRFSMRGIPPEHYHVALSHAGDYYLKHWSAEGVAAIQLKLIAAPGAHVSGTVKRDDQPVGGALVVLANSDDSRATRTGSDGSYDFRGVAPGRYALFALETAADLEYANPSVVQPYLESARKIQLAGGGSYTEPVNLPGATADRPASASREP